MINIMNVPSKQKIAIIIAIFLVLLSGILNQIYRPYIYKNRYYSGALFNIF
jgi:hypothetical protein